MTAEALPTFDEYVQALVDGFTVRDLRDTCSECDGRRGDHVRRHTGHGDTRDRWEPCGCCHGRGYNYRDPIGYAQHLADQNPRGWRADDRHNHHDEGEADDA